MCILPFHITFYNPYNLFDSVSLFYGMEHIQQNNNPFYIFLLVRNAWLIHGRANPQGLDTNP